MKTLSYNLVKRNYSLENALFFIGNGNLNFGHKVVNFFNAKLSKCIISRFADGEIKIPHIEENVRNRDCIIIQSTSGSSKYNPNDLIMEIFMLVDEKEHHQIV